MHASTFLASALDWILRSCKEQQSAIGVVNRSDPKTIHERRAVLAVVQEVDRETSFCAEGMPVRLNGMRARIRALQNMIAITDRVGIRPVARGAARHGRFRDALCGCHGWVVEAVR